jgi:tetratricopeptide (TPR) repeat protein
MKLIIAIVTILGIVGIFNIEPANSSTKYCKVIAYVIYSNDKKYPPGQKICLGEVIRSFSQVTIACSSKNNRFLVKDDRQLKRCETEPVFPNRAEKNEDRGGSDDNQLVLLSPRGKYLLKQKLVTFIWLPVAGAKKYFIKVVNGAEYTTEVNRFSIPFPNSSASFSVIIKSFSDIHEINSAVYTFIVSPENTQNLITKYLNSIDKLSLPEKIKIHLKLSVLAEYNLIDDSLVLLNSQLKKDSQDFESYFSLGDTQFIAGQFDKAISSYEKSYSLAIQNNDFAFEDISKSRLDYIKAIRK